MFKLYFPIAVYLRKQPFMAQPATLPIYDKLVRNKFNVYNSLFLNLPFRQVSNIGMLLPLLYQAAREGLDAGKDPMQILDNFFETHTSLQTEEARIDFMFRVIQYVERQIVLFDSVEDAAFPDIQKDGNHLSLKDFIHLVESRREGSTLAEKLNDFSARVVFTAHPTQFYPPSVLDIISKLRSFIKANQINNIDLTLQQLGMTSFINSKKPTPLDEARNIIYYLQNVYYEAVGELYGHIRKLVPGASFDNPDLVKLGFWPGGDRDGNPNVTAPITMQVADELRITLMKAYYGDITKLEQKLTFKGIQDIIGRLRDSIYPGMFEPDKTMHYDDLIHALYSIRESLITHYNSLYLEDLDAFIDKVRIFRTHFAALDIRQNHEVHQQAVTAVLKNARLIKENLNELKPEALQHILTEKTLHIQPEDFTEELVQDTVRNISQLREIQRKNGEEGCNRYIISNAEDVYSVLFVYALFRWSGWKTNHITFDIIPLFESMEAMQHAESIMRTLFEIPAYRSHLEQRGNRQTIMLGFSDGTKDGGYMQANWAIFKTKEVLTALCEEYGIKAIFFDGRGGPPARGGGKTHQFYAAQSREIANHEIQLTIQGQTISSKYGTCEHFKHNIEQLLTAGLSNKIYRQENTIAPESRALIEEMGRVGVEKYSSLKHHEKFIPYLEKKSTLKYYGRANIGSRPAKRGHKKKLDLEDLRAISFVGSWSQLKQNVPGYFGIGTAIKTLKDQGKIRELQRLFRDVPFFKALILNSMMSMSKSNFALTRYIGNDPEFKDFWNMLHEEYQLSRQMVLEVSGYEVLMEEEQVTRASVAIRERIVLPLLIIQQFALQKVEQNNAHGPVYEKMIQRSLYGNINASRNSA